MNTETMRERLLKFFNATPCYRDPQELEIFIQSEISNAIAKDREDTIQEIEKNRMADKNKYDSIRKWLNASQGIDGYNNALLDIITTIKNKPV